MFVDIFRMLLLFLTGWISLLHKYLWCSKIRNIHWENPIHVVLRFWQLYPWRFGEGVAAFKDISIYIWKSSWNTWKLQIAARHLRGMQIFTQGANPHTYLNPSKVVLPSIYTTFQAKIVFVLQLTTSCAFLEVSSRLMF